MDIDITCGTTKSPCDFDCLEILDKLSKCIDIYQEAIDVFQLFLEAFGEEAWHDLGERKGYVPSVNGRILWPKTSDLWEEFVNIKAHKIGEFNFAVKSAERDSYKFLYLIEMYAKDKNHVESFVNAFKEPKTVSGILYDNLKNFVSDPNIDFGHKPIPAIFSFNVDIEVVAKSMLTLIGKLSPKDLLLTDKDSKVTIGEKLTPELKTRLANLKNDYFFPNYAAGERITLTINGDRELTQEDFKNLEFRALFLEKGVTLRKKMVQFKTDFDKVYYGRR